MAANTSPPILTARGVEKEYIDGERKLRVLGGVDMDVRPGEFISIVGQSGSGKSTLLHILGALDRASSGTVKLADSDYSKMTDRQLARLRSKQVGFVYQFHHLLPEFTALENVFMPGMIARNAQAEIVPKAEELLRRVGLGERLDHRPAKLSGGEQQRVAIARAIINNPLLILADEPTGNLDSTTSGEVLDFLIEVTRNAGKSLLMVTHDQAIADRADQSFHLVGGMLRSR
ncbi:lipoprotein-releasing ABC transporter ATP-binding protein LolD [soil metagenome]